MADAGVVGVADERRGEIPKAFVVCTQSASPGDALRAELMQFVKDRLAKYEYPLELDFTDELPTTETENSAARISGPRKTRPEPPAGRGPPVTPMFLLQPWRRCRWERLIEWSAEIRNTSL